MPPKLSLTDQKKKLKEKAQRAKDQEKREKDKERGERKNQEQKDRIFGLKNRVGPADACDSTVHRLQARHRAAANPGCWGHSAA